MYVICTCDNIKHRQQLSAFFISLAIAEAPLLLSSSSFLLLFYLITLSSSMESEAISWWFHESLHTPFCFHLIFSLLTILSLLLSLSLYLLRPRLWCNCEICHTYITSSWSLQFCNLCDWYTHLLRKSPTKTIHIHVLGNTITANPENVEYMLKTGFENYPKGKPFSTILGDLLGRGIFNVDGEHWKFQRKMASLELGGSRSGRMRLKLSITKSRTGLSLSYPRSRITKDPRSWIYKMFFGDSHLIVFVDSLLGLTPNAWNYPYPCRNSRSRSTWLPSYPRRER